MGDKNNFKGIFYNVNEEQKFFEGGAHFKYNDLYKILESIYKERIKSNSTEKNNNLSNNKIISSYKILYQNQSRNFKPLVQSLTNKKNDNNKKLYTSRNRNNNNINVNFKNNNKIINILQMKIKTKIK